MMLFGCTCVERLSKPLLLTKLLWGDIHRALFIKICALQKIAQVFFLFL